ncbi:MAG: dTDP-4-dehydrorhamnose 3,5-epimerase [Verrucomicrobiota bacterium]|nr:dTDP-4-dehydrorhamnose 3,5-epimerase [Verrucomicrobiota bacterium]
MSLLDRIQITPLQKISSDGGDVWHCLKMTEISFKGYGEAYFSWVKTGAIKAWKQHLQMTMNLVVPVGMVRFVFCDLENNAFREEEIGVNSYSRITVPPKIWFGFKGLNEQDSLVLNIASIPHDSEEVDRIPISAIPFDW